MSTSPFLSFLEVEIMTKEQIFRKVIVAAQDLCCEFCVDFEEDATLFLGYTVFKKDVEYLAALKELLEL
jgi:hypothetical protein